MPEFVNYQLQQLPIRQIDTNLVGNALATITAGNKEALQKQSELRAAIANMDLNEAEDEFRQQLYDDITQTIEDNSIEGNAYYALDDIIKKTGDIASNPGLMGRLKAQQAYKTYQAELDARKDIDQDIRDWAKELNPYHYEDKVDENGRVIGSSEWTPNFTPTSALDMNEIYAIASQYIIPKKNGINTAVFKDVDTGQVSNTYDPTRNQVLVNTTTGTEEKVTKDMAINAINAAINNNPQFAAQMEQSWRVAKWKHDKEPDMPNLAYDGTRELSFDEYKNNLINPFINFHVRTNRLAETNWRITTQAEYTKDVMKDSAKTKAPVLSGLGSDDILADIGEMRGARGNAIELPIRYIDSAVSTTLQKGAEVANLLGVGIAELPDNFDEAMKLIRGKVNINIPNANEIVSSTLQRNFSPEIKNFLNTPDGNINFNFPDRKVFSPEEFNSIKNYYDIYGPSIQSFKNPANLDDEQLANYVESVIITGSGLDSLNDSEPRIKNYKNAYNSAINALFDGDDSATFSVKNNIDISTKRTLENLGMEVNGNKVTINKNNPDAVYFFYKHLLDNNGVLEESNKIKEKKQELAMLGTKSAFTQLYSIKNNSSKSRIAPMTEFFDAFKVDWQNKRIEEVNAGVVDNDPTTLLSTTVYPGISVDDALYSQILEMEGDSKVKTMRDTAAQSILTLAKGGALVNCDIYFVKTNEAGDDIFVPATTDEKREISNYLSSLKLSDVNGNISQIANMMFLPGLNFSKPIYDKFKNPTTGKTTYTPTNTFEQVKILIGDGINDPDLDELNSNQYLQMGKTLVYNWLSDTPTIVGKIGKNDITLRPHNELNSDTYNDLFDIYMGNDKQATVNSKDAIGAVIAYRFLVNDRSNYDFGNTDEEVSKNLGTYFAAKPALFEALIKLYGTPERAFDAAYYTIKE